jgi:hypothetical protein
MLRDLVNRCEQVESDLVIEHAKAVQYELEAQTMRPMLLEAEANLAALRQRLTEIGNHWADVQTEYAAGHGLEGSAAPRLTAALEADHE